MKNSKKILSLVTSIVLSAAIALSMTACSSKTSESSASSASSAASSAATESSAASATEEPSSAVESSETSATEEPSSAVESSEASASEESSAVTESSAASAAESSEESVSEESSEAASSTNVISSEVVGTGKTVFTFIAIDAKGAEKDFEVHTDKTTVGDALSELGLIVGEDSEYGLYVTTVCGMTLDYDKDGMYWAFYINGEYASTGVDGANVEADAEYTLKAE